VRLACLALILSACAAREAPAPPVPPARPAADAAAPKPSPKPLAEENLGGPSKRDVATLGDEAGAAPQLVAPPDPERVVASIGPSTAPQRAASLRLTDEGRRLLEQGDTAAALDRIEKAIKIDPSNPHGYYWLAQVHLKNGRLDQALAFSDKAIVLFAPNDQAWLVQSYTLRATVLEQAGRFREARQSYQRALQLQPGDVAARAGVARLGDPAMSP